MTSKVLRGLIMDILRHIYPEYMMELDIIGMLYQNYRDREIRESLAYLVDRGYIEKSLRPHPFKIRDKIVLYRLTDRGLDVLEGDIKDKCILVPEDE